ncbi:MAG: hypothetical protein LRY73_01845 [Bacillus sp. (in: Bacteria)]|nr:hypothetical protein [Bacillus sp. (in: firmicutes)]
MRNKKVVFTICLGFLSAFLLFNNLPINQLLESRNMLETISYFPEDEQVDFIEQGTEIQLLELKDENEYYLEWQFYSMTDTPVYLRQDVSLLFENGILMDRKYSVSNTEEKITGKATFQGEDSGRHEAISYHYAEIHYPENIIKSKQAISSDVLYIIDSPLSPILTFREPNTTMEERSKEILDSIIDQQLNYIWDRLIEKFQIKREEYIHIPFNELTDYEHESLPGFTQAETKLVMGKLWESIYKYYILGVDTFDESKYDPLGSTMPLILLHEHGGHMIILYETGYQRKQQLFQHIKR